MKSVTPKYSIVILLSLFITDVCALAQTPMLDPANHAVNVVGEDSGGAISESCSINMRAGSDKNALLLIESGNVDKAWNIILNNDTYNSHLMISREDNAGNLIINSSGGRLGIGEDSPGAILHVSGDSGAVATHSAIQALFSNTGTSSNHSLLSIQAGISGYAGLALGHSGDHVAGYIKYNNAADELLIQTEKATSEPAGTPKDRVRIDERGLYVNNSIQTKKYADSSVSGDYPIPVAGKSFIVLLPSASAENKTLTLNPGEEGQNLTLVWGNDKTGYTLDDNASPGTGDPRLNGDWPSANPEDDTLTLIYDGAKWIEISRSLN